MASPAGGEEPDEPCISVSSPTTPSNALAINILKEKVSRSGTPRLNGLCDGGLLPCGPATSLDMPQPDSRPSIDAARLVWPH
jgi:hypothetical protein